MMNCTNFKYWIWQRDLKHYCNYQLVHLDKKMYAPVLMPVSKQSCHLESDNINNWLSVLVIACIKNTDIGASYILAQYLKSKLLFSLIYINNFTQYSKLTLT